MKITVNLSKLEVISATQLTRDVAVALCNELDNENAAMESKKQMDEFIGLVSDDRFEKVERSPMATFTSTGTETTFEVPEAVFVRTLNLIDKIYGIVRPCIKTLVGLAGMVKGAFGNIVQAIEDYYSEHETTFDKYYVRTVNVNGTEVIASYEYDGYSVRVETIFNYDGSFSDAYDVVEAAKPDPDYVTTWLTADSKDKIIKNYLDSMVSN